MRSFDRPFSAKNGALCVLEKQRLVLGGPQIISTRGMPCQQKRLVCSLRRVAKRMAVT